MTTTHEDIDVHTWFSLSYANYLVVPRSVLQSMPEEWQHRFVDLLMEMDRTFGDLDWPRSYRVTAVDENGKFTTDPIPHYNRGRTKLEPKGAAA